MRYQVSLLTAGLLLCSSVSAQTLRTLHTFDAVPLSLFGTNSVLPGALVEDAQGSLYGATKSGGSAATGSVFRIDPGAAFSTLYEFSPLQASTGNGDTNADGVGPNSLVLDSSGTLYGTTSYGGPGGNGTVFKLAAGTLTTVHSFASDRSEGSPSGLTLGVDGNLYGYGGLGAWLPSRVFRISKSGDFALVYAFSKEQLPDRLNADGSRPTSLLQASSGDLYGTASAGGSNGTGIIFRLTTAGVLTPIHEFGPCGACWAIGTGSGSGGAQYANADGAFPASMMRATDGNFYGTTQFGGSAGHGVVFRMTPEGVYTVLHTFSGADNDGDRYDFPRLDHADIVHRRRSWQEWRTDLLG